MRSTNEGRVRTEIKKTLSSFGFWFYILVLINAIPVIFLPCYPTLDGPSHLYNSYLLRQILFSGNYLADRFFVLNTEIIPNWTASGLLSLLGSVFPVFIAEKILQLIIVTGVPLGFYYLVKKLHQSNLLMSVLIFPFSYNHLFCLGFYNFCFGTVLLLITLNVWLGLKDRNTLANLALLVILFTLIYFTHIFVFSIAIIIFGGYILLKYSGDILKKRFLIRKAALQTGILIAAFIPGVILSFKYLIVRNVPSSSTRLPSEELLKWIIDMRAAINYNYTVEARYQHILGFLVLVLIAVAGYRFIRGKLAGNLPRRKNDSDSYIWLILSLVILALYFIFPNQSSGGSYISMRLNLFFYIFFFLWLTSLDLPSWLKKILLAVVIPVNVVLVNHHANYLKQDIAVVKEFAKISGYIEENSIILPVRSSDHWLDLHFSNYLGTNKPQVILENYEAATEYFPLEWNTAGLPVIILADTARTDLCLYRKFPPGSIDSQFVDYVITWGNKPPADECKHHILEVVSRTFDTVYYSQESNITLYRKAGSDN